MPVKAGTRVRRQGPDHLTGSYMGAQRTMLRSMLDAARMRQTRGPDHLLQRPEALAAPSAPNPFQGWTPEGRDALAQAIAAQQGGGGGGGGAWGGGGGGGGGYAALSLPRLQAPSEAEFAQQLQSLITAAVAPLDAARQNLGTARGTAAGDIDSMAGKTRQATSATNAEVLAALQADAQQGRQAFQGDVDATNAMAQRLAQDLAGQGVNADLVNSQGQAAAAQLEAAREQQAALAQQGIAQSRIYGQEALTGVDATAQAGHGALTNTFNRMDSNLMGQRAQAEAQARAGHAEYKQSLLQRIAEQNAGFAAQEAQFNASAANSARSRGGGSGGYDNPIDQAMAEIGLAQAQHDLMQSLEGEQSPWDMAAMAGRGNASTQVLDAARSFPEFGDALMAVRAQMNGLDEEGRPRQAQGGYRLSSWQPVLAEALLRRGSRHGQYRGG